jgi:predicted nucleic acid-binding Zn ribbon protein
LSHTEPHDEFLELCALSTSGELTEEEQTKLDKHFLVCATCRETIKQYESLVAHEIPAIAAKEAAETAEHIDPGPGWSQQRAEASFFNRLAEEESREKKTGVSEPENESSKSTQQSVPFAAGSTWHNVWTMYAAGILLALALGVSLYQVGIRRGVDTVKATLPPPVQQDLTPLEAQVSDAAHDREIALTQVAQRDRQIADLRKQLEKQSAEMAQTKIAQNQLASEVQNSNAGKDDLAKRQAELEAKLAAAQGNVQTSQQKLDGLLKQSSEEQARAAQLAVTVGELTKELNDRNQALQQKDELLAKDRDIRELMGARDLHVAEVYDVARTGETQKPYGRVFFTEGKSLIFYAYDLDQEPQVKNASIFQAWGRRGPDWGHALPLGIFYQDNASKKRWVVKLDDPKTLTQIDAVFVTVEPHGGSHKPSGKPLLFAYLKSEPNHP